MHEWQTNDLVTPAREEEEEEVQQSGSDSEPESPVEDKSHASPRIASKPAVSYQYFPDNTCYESLFLFSQKSRLRRFLYRTIKNQYFDWVIIGFIVLTSIKLALDSYIEDGSEYKAVSDSFDHVFTAIFTSECVIKVLALGFIMEDSTYLRDSWNQLDFVIVVLGLVEYTMNDNKLPFLKVVRLTRVLRPLRFISRNQNMKLVVIALLESFGGIANVVVVIMLCWVMICILGINFVKGKMGYCEGVDDYYGVSKSVCLE